MAVQVNYLTSATAVFLNLQSGLARPYWEVNITVSGAASTFSGTLGQAYSANNDILSMGTIDREKPVAISGLSTIFAGNLTVSLNNVCGTYSPLATASIFTDAAGSAMDYMHSIINVWGGFEQTSGTALVVKRGSFLLTKLRIDSHNRLTHITAEDAARIPLQGYVGVPDLSGTATVWRPPSGTFTKQIMTELLSAVGLSATQYDLTTGLDFQNFELQEANVAEELAKLAQANDGYIYTNGLGKIVFRKNEPTFDGKTSSHDLKDTTNLSEVKYTIDIKNLIKKVQVNYGLDADNSRSSEDATVLKGRLQEITNETIDRASIAGAMAGRLLSQYKSNKAYLELDGLWLPSLEIGNVVSFYDVNTYSTGYTYEIYRIREDINNLTTKLYLVDLTDNEANGPYRQKWGFCSDTSAVNCGTVFTDSWHSGFAFASLQDVSGTGATYEGFDPDGNNDTVIDTGLAVSGAGTTGIELPFLTY